VDGAGGPGPTTAVPDAGASPAAGYETAVPAASPSAPLQEESLNLVKLVGPAIAKRAIPIIVTGVIVLLSLRVMRQRRRRGGEA